MEQVEDVKRYRKVIDSYTQFYSRHRLNYGPDVVGEFLTKSAVKADVEAMIAQSENPDGFFIKSITNRYDVDNITLLGWDVTAVKFEWTVRKSKTSETTAVVRREPKAQPTHDRKGRAIVYTNGKRVVKRRGMASATVVKKTTTTPLTAEQIAERKARLRGGHFVGATYLR